MTRLVFTLTLAIVVIGSTVLGAGCAGPAASPTATPTKVSKPAPETPKPAPQATKPSAATPAAPKASPAASAPQQTKTVKVADLRIITNAALYIAIERGYFKEQGLNPEIVVFDTASKATPALGTGELDIVLGSTSAGLFNAISRGIGIVISIDKGAQLVGMPSMYLVARKDLYISGELKSLQQLKGKKIATASTASGGHFQLVKMLESAGIKDSEVDITQLGWADLPPAFKSKALDAAMAVEPNATILRDQGLAEVLATTDKVLPGFQSGVVLFGEKFIQRDPDAARKFTLAYIKGARDYEDARKKAKDRKPIVDILTKYTTSKDAALLNRIEWPYINPNGLVNRKSVMDEQKWYVERDFMKTIIPEDKLFDDQFVEYAVKQLGEYK